MDVSLDKKVPIKFGKSSGSGSRTGFAFGGCLHCPSVLVFRSDAVKGVKKRTFGDDMFNDDFDEFRARSYSGGFLCFAVDGKRSISNPTTCSEPTATECDVTGNDIIVSVSDVQPGRVRERCHSDEMRRRYWR